MTEQTPTTTPDVVSDTTSETMPDSAPKTGMATMVTAAAATIGASLCCIGPLVLLSLGIGGAWVSSLTALTPYRPYFIGITLLFLFLAFRKLYLVPRSCKPGAVCAIPGTLRNQRIIFWVVTVILVALLTFPYYGTIFFE
ncbi:merT mercuric transport protein [bacterium BMS3Abin11]|nr:merT mercuric transport protein [bacterium BMS3Abin11]GMT39838.1 MAG: mercuric transporter [bacterium]